MTFLSRVIFNSFERKKIKNEGGCDEADARSHCPRVSVVSPWNADLISPRWIYLADIAQRIVSSATLGLLSNFHQLVERARWWLVMVVKVPRRDQILEFAIKIGRRNSADSRPRTWTFLGRLVIGKRSEARRIGRGKRRFNERIETIVAYNSASICNLDPEIIGSIDRWWTHAAPVTDHASTINRSRVFRRRIVEWIGELTKENRSVKHSRQHFHVRVTCGACVC